MDDQDEGRLRTVELELAKLQTKVGVVWAIVVFIGGTIGSSLLVGIMTLLMRGGLK